MIKWTTYTRHDIDLVNPANKRNIDVIVVGYRTGGWFCRCYPGGARLQRKDFLLTRILLAEHTPLPLREGSTLQKITREMVILLTVCFTTLMKGGDYQFPREANVYRRLAEVSANIIDQCVAQGVPFARDYGGLLDNRSFGGVLVSQYILRQRSNRAATATRCAYSAMNRQIRPWKDSNLYNRHEMLDLVIVDGKARGIIARDYGYRGA